MSPQRDGIDWRFRVGGAPHFALPRRRLRIWLAVLAFRMRIKISRETS